MQHVKWVSLITAMEYTGHVSPGALGAWCRRFNRANRHSPILRRHGYVDMVTLRSAIELTTKRATPELAAMALYIPPIKKRTRRQRPTEPAEPEEKKR